MADERIGTSFTIDVTQLKAGLKTANKLIRESQSEFKKAAAGLDDWSKSEDGLNAKITSLNSITQTQREKVRALKEQYEKLKNSVDENGKAFDETSDRAVELRTKINQEEAALKSNEAELEKQKTALKKLEAAGGDAELAFEDLTKETEKSSKGFTVMKGALANLVADGFRAAIQAAKSFAQEVVNVGISFDDSMAQVAAVSGATGDELQKLREKAKEMGSTTKFTASEAADAFNYMAMAGWKTEDMLGGIEGILNLAAASGSDLATTSDIVTDALTAMGYEAKDAGRLADVMAAASSNANTNVEMMGLTFQYAAPIVGALGYSMEDTAVAIGLMANAGIKGEKSGTALRSILTHLSAPPKECADAMTALGISIVDSNGKMKSLDTIMQDLRKSFDGLSETEQTAYAKSIAGQEAMSGLLAIVNAAPADFEKLTKAVEDSNGAAQTMADTMLNTLGGDMTVLKSQIEGVRLTIFEQLAPTLRGFVSEAQKAISKINWEKVGKKANEILKTLAKTGKNFAKNVLPTISKALSVVWKALDFVINNFSVLSKVVLIAVTAFKAFKATMAVVTAINAAKTAVAGLSASVSLATKMQTGWNAVMAANPIGAVITAVGLLAGGIMLLTNSQNDLTDSTEGIVDAQHELVQSSAEAAEAYRDNKRAAEEVASANIANVDYVKNNLLPQLSDLIDANGEVKAGDEARAQFILGQLNEAYGIEYQKLSDIVDANGQIKQSIYDVIDAKKAQILLEAYEDTYREAVENVSEAETARAEAAQNVADAQNNVEEAYRKAEQAWEDYDNAFFLIKDAYLNSYNIAMKSLEDKKKILAEEQAAYVDASKTVEEYYSDIDAYRSASQAAMEGNSQKTIDILNKYGSGFKTAASVAGEVVEEQRRILGQQVIDAETNYQLLLADYKAHEDEMSDEQIKAAQARIENARRQAEDAKAEFYDVGGNITKGMADGAGESSWILDDAMTKIINDAVEAAKNAADINSPSRKFRNLIGRMLGLGIADGIKDSTKNVVSAVRQQIDDIEKAYDFNGFENSVNAGLDLNGAGGVNNSRTVTVNQYNTYSQAHSRYELYQSKQQTAAAVRLALGTV